MIVANKNILKIFVTALILLTLFTPLQAYYSAYIHIVLLFVCLFVCSSVWKKVTVFLTSSLLICMLFAVLSVLKNENAVMQHVGFFLHYITWPLILACVVKKYSREEIHRLLCFILLICFIGDILSLIQLNINPDISRLLAGTHLQEEKVEYYKLGVGGYGYVYAMVFLTYGIIRWLQSAERRSDKLLLIAFLVINSAFLLYASYTLAIVLTILFFGLAMISEVQKRTRFVIIILAMLLIVLFGRVLMEGSYQIANMLNLKWVAKRFEQLLYAREMDDLSTLKRFDLYWLSIKTFLAHPFVGGKEIGEHSQILDTFGKYGISAVFLVVFFRNCMKMCNRIIGRNVLSWLFFLFMIFALIDTCSVMQIPVTVFFVVPLIVYMESDENSPGKFNKVPHGNR